MTDDDRNLAMIAARVCGLALRAAEAQGMTRAETVDEIDRRYPFIRSDGTHARATWERIRAGALTLIRAQASPPRASGELLATEEQR